MKRLFLMIYACLCAVSLMAVPAYRELKGDAREVHRPKQRNLEVRRVAANARRGIERETPQRVLVLLVNYKDIKFKDVNTKQAYDSLFNSTNYTTFGATGSVAQYFDDQSFGQYRPKFDVIGPITLQRGYAYYGQNDDDGDDMHAEQMIVDACQLADSEVDYSLYDSNGDGYVDCVYVIYAGRGEADSDIKESIWPHNAKVEDAWYDDLECVLDGKHINTYVCSSEVNNAGYRQGIGTPCHEFSHVLGLPDMYVTDGDGDWKTLGSWDIMDYGAYNNLGRTPPAYSAYERFFMGWTEPYLMNEPMNFVLHDINISGECGMITKSGQANLNGLQPDPAEFYLVENRQQEGWDKYIPGHGMMLTRIAFVASRWENNIINNLEHGMSVDIVEADGKAPHYAWDKDKEQEANNGYRGKQKDLFPAGAQSVELFTKKYALTSIEETNDGIVMFDFMGGVDKCEVSFYAGQYGTCATQSLSESSKKAGVVLPSVTAKSGYTFLGWATRKTSTTPDAGKAGDRYYPMSDCTLFALYRDDTHWLVDISMKGVVWEEAKTTDNKNVYDKVDRGKDFYIVFSAKDGYNTPSAKTCKVVVKCGSKLLNVHKFVDETVRLDFKASDVTDNLYISISNTREQGENGCEDYSYSFTKNCLAGANDFGEYEWKVTIKNTEGEGSYSKTKGAAFGSNKSAAEEVHFVTDETMGCAIASIKVNASVASQGDAVLNVYVAGNVVGESEWLDENATEYVFTPSEPTSGNVDIRFVNSQKTVYIKSIDIEFTALPDPDFTDAETGKSTSIGAENNVSSAEIYAANGTIYVQDIEEGSELAVYDNLGRLILSRKIIDNNLQLNVSNGIYFIQIKNNDLISTTKIIVV